MTTHLDAAAPMPALRLDLLQSFVVAAEDLHLTQAAARLYVSQSGLSRRIATLERDLGRQLFERAGRSVELTAAGRALLPHARFLVAAARAASAALDEPRRLPLAG